MTCSRRLAGAHRSAPPPSAGSRRKPDLRPGRSLLPALALLLGALCLFPAAPAAAQTAVLVSNVGQSMTTTFSALCFGDASHAQRFTTGGNAGGYRLTSIEVAMNVSSPTAQDKANFRAELWSAVASGENAGEPNAKLASLTVPSFNANGSGVAVAFTPSGTVTLFPSTQYYIILYSTSEQSTIGLPLTLSGSQDAGGKANWGISDKYRSKGSSDPGDANESWSEPQSTAALKIRVKGTELMTVPPTTLTLTTSAPSNTAAEDAATVTVTATLNQPAGTGGVEVTLTAGGSSTATATDDYTLPAAFTIGLGRRSATADVTIVDDNVDEDNETIVLTTTVSGLTVTAVTLTITDNDAAPVLSIGSPSVAEGDSGTANLEFVVSLAGRTSRQVTVAYADATTGTATSGTDYTAVTAGTLTFAAGETAKTVTVAVTGDTVLEQNETVVLRLSSPSNATLKGGVTELDGTGTITNDEEPELSISSPSVAEGDSGTADLEFVVSLAGGTSRQVTVAYADSGDGTATSGTDYTAVTAGTLTFAAGDTAKTVTVAVTGDTVLEQNETVVLRLSSPSNATLKGGVTELDGTGTITNDEEPELSISSPSVAEGDSGTADLEFVVSLAGGTSRQVTVAYADSGDGTATSGTDYTALTAGTLTFAAGDSAKTVTVTVTADTVDEPNETVVLELSSASNATLSGGAATLDGTGTINDDDPAPELSISSPSVAEGDSETADLAFVVSLAGSTSQQVTVAYADSGEGTATSGTDYTAVTAGTLTFAAGDTAKTVTVTVTGDTVLEQNETVLLRLSSPSNATLKGGVTELDGTGTITNDEEPELSISSPSVAEGDSGTADLAFVVSLAGGTSQQVTVAYADTGRGTATSGTDYTAVTAGTLTFAAGDSAKTVTVAVTGDTVLEQHETVVLQLSSPSNATLKGGVATLDGTGTITNDEEPELSISSPSVAEGDSGTADLAFVVSLAGGASQQVTVAYADTGRGTATSGTDYTAVTAGTLTFAVGDSAKTVTVTVTADTVDEPNETVVLQLSSASNATLSGGAATLSGTGTINDDDTAPVLSTTAPSVAEGNSGTADLAFVVSLAGSTSQEVTVAYADTGDGTATSGTDYTAVTAGTLTFAAGDMAKTVTVTVTADTVDEPNETVVLRLSSPSKATLAGGVTTLDVTGTITDDDAAPVLSISSPSVAEGDGGTADLAFVVSLAGGTSRQVTVAYKDAGTGTATSGTDYTAVTAGTLTFAAGDTAKTVTVTVTGDTALEAHETVVLRLSSPSNATLTGGVSELDGTGTITNDEEPELSISSPSVAEGDSGTADLAFVVSLAGGASQRVTVAYADTGEGTATSGTDYTAVTAGTLTFAVGDSAKTVTVAVTGDTVDERHETVVLRLSSASNATLSGGTATLDGKGTITDDDAELSISSPSVAEGNSGTADLEFVVSLAGITSQQVTVAYADTGRGTATSGTDYTAVTAGTLTFAAGDTAKTVTVTVTGDAVDEPNETVVLQLSSPSNATLTGGVTMLSGTGTITDDDAPPVLSIGSPSVAEGNSGTADLAFVVTLTGSTSRQVTVAYKDSGTGTATSGTDYTVVTAGTLTFAAGDTAKTVTVAVTGDAVDERHETVVLRLSSPSNATLKGGVTELDGTGTITDDESAPVLSIGSPSVAEGNSGTADLAFVVTLSGSTSQEVTVAYADATTGTATSGTDYTAVTAGTLTFAAGDSAKTVTVTVTADTVDEPNETVVLKLSSASNATLSGGAATLSGTGTITDDDAAPVLSISSPGVEEGDSGTANLAFVVTLSGSTSQQVTVAYADATTGTATSGTDYTAVTAGTLTFAAGDSAKTVTVTVTGDTVLEPHETVVLRLSSPSNATLKGGVTELDGTGTITNDEELELSISSPSVEEGDSGTANLAFVVSLAGGASQQVTVAYADSGEGTATSGTDYTAVTAGTLTFAVGDSAKTVTVAVTGDTVDERHETVVLRLSSASNATLSGGAATLDGTGTITDDDAELSISSPSVAEGNSGTANLAFVVSLAGISSQQVKVAYADRETGTATSGTDYSAVTAGTLTFAAGDTSKTVTVSVTGDTSDEANETVVLRLSSATNASLSGGGATLDGTGTITDDDASPELSIGSPSVAEGNSGTANLGFVVTLTGSTNRQVTVAYADRGTGTATSGTDYSAVTAGTLTFAAGDTSKTVTVSVTGDTADEANETVVLRLSSATNASLSGGGSTLDGTGTITDDDGAPELSISSPSVAEGNSGTANLGFVVTLAGSTNRQVTVAYADRGTGTATSGTDYSAVTAGTLTFAAGDTTKTVTVSVTGDTADEANETVVLRLSSATNASLSGGGSTLDGTGTITDDDAAPELSISSPSVAEGNSGTANLGFVVTLTGSTNRQVTVAYADRGTGTATSGTDYSAVTAGTLTFAAGDTTKTVTVSVTGDTADEANETVVLRLSSATNASLSGGGSTLDGTGTITDDDAAPELSISSPSVAEGNSGTANLGFVVTLTGSTNRQVTVAYADRETGTATSGTDYSAVTAGTLTFAAGETSKTVTVSVTGDTSDEANETVVLRLSSATNASLSGGAATLDGTGTITDDDGAPVLSISSPSVAEGDSGTANLAFVVTLSGSTNQQVTVAYADSGDGTATSGTDYTAVTAGTLTFAAGDSAKTVTVTVTGDTVLEPDETVVLRLSSPSNATLTGGVTTLDGTGTITNDEEPVLSINTPSVAEGDSGTANLAFVVTLSGSTNQQVTVAYADTGTGTATSGTDYAAVTAGTLTFAAGDSAKTVTVTVTGDTVDEPNETVVLRLSSASNATLSGGAGTLDGTGTITDDDAASSDATLSDLKGAPSTDGTTFRGTLNLGTFASTTMNYVATVENVFTHVKLTPTVADTDATVTVQGSTVPSGTASDAIALVVGSNVITVRVTAQDSTTQDYTVTVTRQAPPEGPPVEADVSSAPEKHDGSRQQFQARIQFSEEVTITDEEEFKNAIRAEGGTVVAAKRLRGDLWEITVEPTWDGAVVLAVDPPTGSCSDQDALCAPNGRRLSATVEALVLGPSTGIVTITPVSTAITEGRPAVFRLRRSGGTELELTVDLSVGGADDFMAGGKRNQRFPRRSQPSISVVGGRQTVVFPAGEAVVLLNIATEDDSLSEPGALLTVQLSEDTASPPHYVLGESLQAVLQVRDNDGGADPPPLPGTGSPPPVRSTPLPLQLALWTDRPGYLAGETVRLFHTIDPHDDRGQYRVFAWLEPAAGGDRRYLAPLSADAKLHAKAVDIRGLPEHLSQAGLLARADKALAWGGESLAPGLWRFVLELRPGSADEQYEKPAEPMRTRRAWASFTLAERSQGLNRSGIDREIRTDATLRSDTLYYLGHQLFVQDGATLTIEPGTVVLGWGRNTAIIVEPGGRIVAEGTCEAPVVLGCSAPVGQREPGCWGGLRILGRAPVTRLEGVAPGVLPADRAVYGGTDAEDSSGVLQYVRVEYAGAGGRPEAPAPAVGIYGAGSGTVLDHVQARGSLGAGIAFSGGTARCGHCVSSGSGTAGLAWERGWRGGASHLYVHHGSRGYDGLAGRNDDQGHDLEPRSVPTLSNVTLVHAWPYGRRERAAVALRLSAGSGVRVRNLLATRFSGGAVEAGGRSRLLFEDGESSVDSALLFLNGSPQMRDGLRVAVEFADRDPKLRDVRDFANPDPRPKTGSPALTNGGEGYIGAFDEEENWLEEWTVFGPESAYHLQERGR